MLDKRVKFALDNFLNLEPANRSYKILFSELSYQMSEQGEGKSCKWQKNFLLCHTKFT